MFWRVSGFSQPSPVEAALDRANCSLEDLLAEDDLVQVCRPRAFQIAPPASTLHHDLQASFLRGSVQFLTLSVSQHLFLCAAFLSWSECLPAVLPSQQRAHADPPAPPVLPQEVKSLNSRVLAFLTRPQSVTGLVRHLVAPATPDADQQQQLRQPFTACEVGPTFCISSFSMSSFRQSSPARAVRICVPGFCSLLLLEASPPRTHGCAPHELPTFVSFGGASLLWRFICA